MRPATSPSSPPPPPPPSTASPTSASSATLPIARAGNSTWEKPERARTSHACEPCRERKTKCDGSRPACRRCLHTGTSCYYGYGKGWRKRKTAEDLTATSRRLARYESLLNEIMPMVSPEVRSLIEEARETDNSTGSNTSETAENEFAIVAPRFESSIAAAPAGRIILPLPVPSPHLPSGPRGSTSSSSYDPVPPVATPHAMVTGSAGPGPGGPGAPRRSPESFTRTRLPSITSGGFLIETGTRDLSPPPPLDAAAPFGPDRPGVLPTSPTSHSSQGESWRRLPYSPG